MKTARERIAFAACMAALAAQAAADAWCQPAWRPAKAVEVIIPTAASGPSDLTARFIQKILQEQKRVTVPLLVINKAGGNQTLAVVYLNQHPADPHYLLYGTPSVFANQLSGLSPIPYTDITPIAMLSIETNAIAVSADSPLKNMRDLTDRLRADPEAIAFGMPSRGGSPHLFLSLAVRAEGVDPKKLKVVVFKTSAEGVTAAMGGHIHAVVSSAGGYVAHVQAGNMRVLAIAAPQRQGGALAQAPTLRELGIAVAEVATWRGIFGPKGLAPAHIAFWEEALAAVVATDDWKKRIEENNLRQHFLRSNDFAKYLESDFVATRAVMTDLGLVK